MRYRGWQQKQKISLIIFWMSILLTIKEKRSFIRTIGGNMIYGRGKPINTNSNRKHRGTVLCAVARWPLRSWPSAARPQFEFCCVHHSLSEKANVLLLSEWWTQQAPLVWNHLCRNIAEPEPTQLSLAVYQKRSALVRPAPFCTICYRADYLAVCSLDFSLVILFIHCETR